VSTQAEDIQELRHMMAEQVLLLSEVRERLSKIEGHFGNGFVRRRECAAQHAPLRQDIDQVREEQRKLVWRVSGVVSVLVAALVTALSYLGKLIKFP
jgi:uncharacterized coiled-coil protein SlyX